MAYNFSCVLGKSNANCPCFKKGGGSPLLLHSLKCALKHENTRGNFLNFLKDLDNQWLINKVVCYVDIDRAWSEENKRKLLQRIFHTNPYEGLFDEGMVKKIEKCLKNKKLKMKTVNDLFGKMQQRLENDLDGSFKAFVLSRGG